VNKKNLERNGAHSGIFIVSDFTHVLNPRRRSDSPECWTGLHYVGQMGGLPKLDIKKEIHQNIKILFSYISGSKTCHDKDKLRHFNFKNKNGILSKERN